MATHGLPAWPWAGTPAEDLPAAERLLLDGARLWADAARHGHPPLPAARMTFIAEGTADAIAPLDALLRAIAPIAAGCPLCPRVASAEAVLLLGCALAQRGAQREALALLLHHLPPGAAQDALAAAVEFGNAFARAGLLLRNPLRCRRD